MSRNKFTNLKFENDHLSEYQLLMFADGELSNKEAVNAREHLETCWTCRSELENIEETISLFVEFRKKVQIPLSVPPPNDWNNFNRLIRQAQKEAAQPRRNWFTLSNLSPFQLRIGIASASVVLITALFLQLVTVPNVSAKELFDKATVAQNEKIESVSQPVRYQKLRVRSGSSQSIDWEVWNDIRHSRSKQAVNGQQSKEGTDTLQTLVEVLKKNKLNPLDPLSPGSLKAWHGSLSDKTDEVTENDSITLKTTNNKIVFDGQITETTVKFHRLDFHPFEQTLKVRTDSGEKTFEISEVDFEIVSLTTLKPNFFDETSTSNIVVMSEKAPAASPESSPVSTENGTLETENSPGTVATADLEVEVLQLLNSAKADLGEEIKVSRENGLLYVRGLVETSERKNEILTALQSVRLDPAVRIDLETVAEAVARRKDQAPKPTKIDDLETRSLIIAAQSDLVEHFGNEAEAKQFAARTVSRSSQAMSHIYALRKLSRQFSSTELKALSPEAKSKWLGLITSHARSFKVENGNLIRELGSVFGTSGASGSTNVPVNSADNLPRAIESLFSIAANNDRLIRSALTVSADDGKLSVLKAAHFWQSLKNADALANRIAALK